MPRVLARSHVDETTPLVNGKHCRIWEGARGGHNRYPYMRLGGVCVRVTRYVLAHAVRRFRPGEEALHACDNVVCIEQAHLRHGTKAENMREMWARGRRYRPSTFLVSN